MRTLRILSRARVRHTSCVRLPRSRWTAWIEINQTSILAAPGGFPYTIPASGSYVLTSDLTPTPGERRARGGRGQHRDQPERVHDHQCFRSRRARYRQRGVHRPGGATWRRIGDSEPRRSSPGTNSKVIETKLSGNGAGVASGPYDCLIVMNTIVGNSGGDGASAQHCKIENNVITVQPLRRDRRWGERDRPQPDRQQRRRRDLRLWRQHHPAECDQWERLVRNLGWHAGGGTHAFPPPPPEVPRTHQTSSGTRSATR